MAVYFRVAGYLFAWMPITSVIEKRKQRRTTAVPFNELRERVQRINPVGWARLEELRQHPARDIQSLKQLAAAAQKVLVDTNRILEEGETSRFARPGGAPVFRQLETKGTLVSEGGRQFVRLPNVESVKNAVKPVFVTPTNVARLAARTPEQARVIVPLIRAASLRPEWIERLELVKPAPGPGVRGEKATYVLRAKLPSWAPSKEAELQVSSRERAFRKVPNLNDAEQARQFFEWLGAMYATGFIVKNRMGSFALKFDSRNSFMLNRMQQLAKSLFGGRQVEPIKMKRAVAESIQFSSTAAGQFLSCVGFEGNQPSQQLVEFLDGSRPESRLARANFLKGYLSSKLNIKGSKRLNIPEIDLQKQGLVSSLLSLEGIKTKAYDNRLYVYRSNDAAVLKMAPLAGTTALKWALARSGVGVSKVGGEGRVSESAVLDTFAQALKEGKIEPEYLRFPAIRRLLPPKYRPFQEPRTSAKRLAGRHAGK